MSSAGSAGRGGEEGGDRIAPLAFLPGVREANEKRAENVTLHALTRRGMSRAEVADLLARREIDPVVIDTELQRLERSGLIDDAALAVTLVDRLVCRKKLGARAIRAELSRRRVDAGAAEAALSALDSDNDSTLVRQLVEDRVRRIGSVDRETAERRLLGYLARKGHGGAEARTAVSAALDELGLERGPRRGFGTAHGTGASSRDRLSRRSNHDAGEGLRRVEFE
jgi:regulatory protein